MKDEIKAILDKNKNDDSKVMFFEVEPGTFTEHFDDGDIDFSTFSEHTQENGGKYYSFMISGGLNGSGEWEDYLEDVKEIFSEFTEELNLDPVLYKLETDVADDVWTAEVLVYEDATEEQLEESLLYEKDDSFDYGEPIQEDYDDYSYEADYLTALKQAELRGCVVFTVNPDGDKEEEFDSWEDAAEYAKENGFTKIKASSFGFEGPDGYDEGDYQEYNEQWLDLSKEITDEFDPGSNDLDVVEDLGEKLLWKDPRDRRKKVVVPKEIEYTMQSDKFKEWVAICRGFDNGRGIQKHYDPELKKLRYLFTFRTCGVSKEFLEGFFNKFGINNLESVATHQGGHGHADYEAKLADNVELHASEGFRIYSLQITDTLPMDTIESLEEYRQADNDIDVVHGDVENAPYVVDADGELFGFDTRHNAEYFMKRNEYSYDNMRLVKEDESDLDVIDEDIDSYSDEEIARDFMISLNDGFNEDKKVGEHAEQLSYIYKEEENFDCSVERILKALSERFGKEVTSEETLGELLNVNEIDEDIIIKPGSTVLEQKYKEFDTRAEAVDFIIAENGFGEMQIRYIPKTKKYRVVWEEAKQLEEDIEKHDTLNPKLWNPDNTLKPEVEAKIREIVDDFLKGLADDEIKFNLKDIKLVGSNCSYNYTKDSDLDVHLVADTDSLKCPDNLYPLLYSAYRSIYNKNHDISFYGIPVELFVETDDTEIEPDAEPLTEATERLNVSTPYMLRNDGKLLTCGAVHPYIKMSSKASVKTNLHTLFDNHPDFLDWYLENTNSEEVKELIPELIREYGDGQGNEMDVAELLDLLNDLTNQEFCRVRTSNYKVPYGGDNGEIYFRISSTGFNWFNLIWDVVNKFSHQIKKVSVLRDAQTFGGKEFDYYKLKGQPVNHMPAEEFLTAGGNPVMENCDLDEAAKTAVKSNGIYSVLHNKWIKEPVQSDIPELDREAFEKLFNEWEDKYYQLLDKEGLTADDISSFIEDLYDLRKSSIASEGEYGLGNLVFKEFRNLGYLDGLKDYKGELRSKELSLENLK